MASRDKHDRMANAIRFLSMDAVEKANSGHPGLPMGMADVATVLFTRYLKYDPNWPRHAKIVHFHSFKPDFYQYRDGVVRPLCNETQAQRLSDDLYLAVLMWFRHLHRACNALRFDFPTLSSMPLEFVEKELNQRRSV